MSESKTILVEFLKNYTPYTIGDITAISEADFKKLSPDEFVKEYVETNPATTVFLKHTVTEQDLEINPELVEKGIVVGDVIEFPEPTEAMKLDELKAIAEEYKIEITGLKSKKEVAEAIKQYETK